MFLAFDSARARGINLDFHPLRELSLVANAMETLVSKKGKMEELVWKYLGTSRSYYFLIVLITQSQINSKMRSNVQEVMARGAQACIISMEGMEDKNDQLVLPYIHEALTPFVAVITFQLIAYYVALYRGCDIDKGGHFVNEDYIYGKKTVCC